MEGLGNDYIYLNCMETMAEEPDKLARVLSERHFGVGSDGLICIKPGQRGDFTMEMYNADGSRGAMCGNGIRCLGKYVYDKGLTRKRCLTVDTDAGPRTLELHVGQNGVEQVTVDMGAAQVFPVVELEAAGEGLCVVPVSVGNPHAVIFCPDAAAVDLERLGPAVECHPQLPERSNVEFVSLSDRVHLEICVWERGSGVTLACGTGACAAFAAACKAGLCEHRVEAYLPGGTLQLELRGKHIFMTGPAHTVFEGELSL